MFQIFIDCEGDFLCKLIHMFDSHKVSVCQRLNLEFMLIEHVKDYFKRIKENGFIDVRNRKGIIFFSFFVIDRAKDTWSLNSLPFFVAGKFEYRVTEESLMDRLTTNTHEACLSIHENCR